ncbi:hypothetical protein N7520_009729 [Penicillium odoratum]|uniref:uncharacterized protein n=1 Tax=Penicillium odoratum TaxID=1167516 RepID=UPI002547E7C2|nr:uncharacterized protein N7520_009729 [Penicillium odoratum]KAJ5653023.1 hypothetical protein N7490_000026 [Penicillium lividum]KAJ5752812.1 hypothetical protein N7520_009729 [Penicillium odoratum]
MAEKCAQAGCSQWALSGSRYCSSHKPPGSQQRPAMELDINRARIQVPDVASDSEKCKAV